MAARARTEARRDPLPLRAARRGREGRADGAHDARDGEGETRGRGRRPGSDRHELLHGRRGSSPVRADDAVGAPEQVPDVRPHADRRRRGDHAVELPDRDSLVEDGPGARRGEHDRLQARDGYARARPALRRAPRRGRRPEGRREHRARRRRRGRRRAGASPGRPRDHAHGLARDGREGARGRRGAAQARPPRARRQERDHRHGRRRPRPRARGDPVVGVRHVGAALHRDEPRDRPRQPLRLARSSTRRAGGSATARARVGGRHRRRPRDQRGARSRRSIRTRRWERTTAPRC